MACLKRVFTRDLLQVDFFVEFITAFCLMLIPRKISRMAWNPRQLQRSILARVRTLRLRLRAEMVWARVYAVELALIVVVALLCAARSVLSSASGNGVLSAPARRESAIQPHHLFITKSVDPAVVADLLIEAIIQVESAGDPLKIGTLGERGLMQIKPGTWRQVTQRVWGTCESFDAAFDPELNVQVGRAYLVELQRFLVEHRREWKSDERALLLACYNVGPNRVKQAKFDVARLPASVRDYVQRAAALHDFYLAEQAPIVRALLSAGVPAKADASG